MIALYQREPWPNTSYNIHLPNYRSSLEGSELHSALFLQQQGRPTRYGGLHRSFLQAEFGAIVGCGEDSDQYIRRDTLRIAVRMAVSWVLEAPACLTISAWVNRLA